MEAVIASGGKQYRVTPGQVIARRGMGASLPSAAMVKNTSLSFSPFQVGPRRSRQRSAPVRIWMLGGTGQRDAVLLTALIVR